MKNFYPKVFLLSFCLTYLTASAQTDNLSSIAKQDAHYSQYNLTTNKQWDSLFLSENPGITRKILPKSKSKSSCQLNKVVYGWNPYWSGTAYNNYQWNLLSHLCYFAYAINPATGNASTMHEWTTDPAIDSALANGVKVNLCVTLFGSHATFLENTTSRQTCISNLISLVQARGAQGVNIDFEAMPVAQSANFTSFMIALCTQMHAAIPGSEVSIALPAVDWSNVIDETSLLSYVDMFIVMGYDYYYSGSTTAGPSDPLYNFVTTYNYTVNKSINYYLNQGVSNSKLLLGLPYYGIDWATQDNSVPSATTSTGSSRFYNVVRNNTNGYYSNKQWNNTSFTPYFPYQNTGVWHQCWIDDAYSMGKRFDVVNQRGLKGIGIWALGYDDGYTDYWNKIKDKFSSCSVVNCTDTIYDMGGPSRNYYDNENYTYTIAPNGATNLSLTFSSFSVADDTLWLYNGNSTTSPLIGAYTSTNSPGTVTSTGNSLTLKFRSRASTNSTGWSATWHCSSDNTAPATAININGNWQTQNFTASFTDTDNSGGSGVNKKIYQVSDFNGTEWTANAQNGFFNDDFNSLNTSVWTVPASSGTWLVSGGNLVQKDTSANNSNIYASLNQNLSDCYLYHFNAKIENSVFGTSQRRFGFHFFSDNASLANRGNSYFIYFRNELSTLEFYKVVNDTYTQTNVINNIITTPGQLYDFKVIYNKTTGKIDIYRNNILLGSWTDSSPYTTNGNFISFRTGNCKATIDNIKVYRSRNSSAILTVGAAGTNDIRYQNTDSTTFSAKIFSIVTDLALNISPISEKDINIDWTPSSTIIKVNDGTSATDIDNTNIHTTISANWSKSIDVNSKINHYSYCFGTTPGGTDLIAWTNNGMDTVVTISGINLQNGTTYYCSVKAEDGAGLVSNIAISDGIAIKYMADFYAQDTVVCEGDAVNFINTSVNSSNYLWTFAGGTPSTSASVNPMVIYNTTGNYDVKLYTTGSSGSDSLIKLQYITVNPKAHANFTVSDTIVSLPSANVVFVNTSTNATSYLWNFGDGGASAQNNPWHSYNLSGKYTITLIAYNNSCGNDTLVSDTLIRVSGLGISEINTVNNLTVFPNPSSGNLTISFDLQKSDYVEICIFDKAGRQIVLLSKGKIMQGKFRTEIYTNNIGISSGTYLLGIKEGKKIYYTEIVIL